ncbi:MAG: hypothetical protein LBE35_06635 [Clostridiales bacterium]|jgi:hypothetical protein|nr:hypothetical protein [Clostridiales bacterium]
MNKDLLKWTVEITKASVESGSNSHGDDVSGFMKKVYETLEELTQKAETANPPKPKANTEDDKET